MYLERQCIQSIMAKVDDLLFQEGFKTSGVRNATLMMGYPTKDDVQVIIKPLIIVSNMDGNDYPIELGSNDGTELLVIIDVIAEDDGQRDDLGFFLRKEIRGRLLPIYNFTVFPTTPGDYTGINTLGKMIIMNTGYTNMEPDVHDLLGFNHHQEVRLTVRIPSD